VIQGEWNLWSKLYWAITRTCRRERSLWSRHNFKSPKERARLPVLCQMVGIPYLRCIMATRICVFWWRWHSDTIQTLTSSVNIASLPTKHGISHLRIGKLPIPSKICISTCPYSTSPTIVFTEHLPTIYHCGLPNVNPYQLGSSQNPIEVEYDSENEQYEKFAQTYRWEFSPRFCLTCERCGLLGHNTTNCDTPLCTFIVFKSPVQSGFFPFLDATATTTGCLIW
jgi:ferredoxin